MKSKRSLELFYIDGRPSGLITAEIFDWTGHVLSIPRTSLEEALKRREAAYTGVYLLLGQTQQGVPCAYIGEAGELRSRIRQHEARTNMDWWERVVLITTTNNQLHKAYGQYLEARLIAEARKIQHTPLENNTNPTPPDLREAERANMEGFLENLFLVLPALRVDMFIDNVRSAGSASLSKETTDECHDAQRFQLYYRKYDITAYAILRDGDFTIEAGSEAYPEWKGRSHDAYGARHDELLRRGVLKPQGDHKAVFTMDYVCSSTSEAAAIVQGRSAAGPQMWRVDGTKQSYKEWEAHRLKTSQVGEDEAPYLDAP